MTMVKNVLRGQKCDVVLHDGAPNVGANWLKDAFSQSELCLFALKMATEFLKPEGLFITKVFRSKDYTSLMWVLNQFFTKVEATKPKASRDASAEIYICCFGYKAPKEIDPKLFDSSLVFEDVEAQKKKLKLSFRDLAKQKPNQEGYEEGLTLLYKKCSVAEFIETEQPIKILVDYNELEFDESSQIYLNHPLTTKDIIEACEDLRVLGKPDFRMLLKWRNNMKDFKDELDAENNEDIIEQDEEDEVLDPIHEENNLATASDEMELPSDEEELEGELKELKDKHRKIEKKKEKKLREKQKKLAIKAATERPEDMLDIYEDTALFRMKDISSKDMLNAVLDPSVTSQAYDAYLKQKELKKEQVRKEKEALGKIELDEDERDEILEAELDALYQQLMEKKTRRFKASILQSRDDHSQKKNELYEAINYEEEKYGAPNTNPLLIEHRDLGSKQSKADQFFNQNIFSVLMEEATGNSDNEDDNATRTKRRKLGRLDNITEEDLEVDSSDSESDNDDDDEEDESAISDFKRKVGTQPTKQDVGGFEIMPKEMKDPEVRATALALGKKLLRKKERREFIDNAFHRYAFNDEDVPDWLADDEVKSFRKQDPITKEEADEIKRKMAEIDARPIKAVLEAKIRRKFRAQKKIKEVKDKAEVIAQSQELTPQEKSKELMKLYKNASVKTSRRKVYVVGGGKKVLGKKSPGSIMKFVDNRTKKDKRAQDSKKRKR
ncbi:hypothetical protein C9374_014477 [Naegleria lovaniensis]|uniref:rRNA methyltransferase n=1 Tax=Naegleria lovaniensis TaxID=51637 RepID=A0AA88GUE5_NAELO|nr:uncharacterized protein C9374_014477 [Naegleria lovaniensis]KAG2389077.1 hypothetical protein C9374_014477 [Naegleria lovaniensis]